jgi:hypothetical protein
MRSRKKPILFAITIVIMGLLITSTATSINFQKVLKDASTLQTFERALTYEIAAIEHTSAYKLSSSVYRSAGSLAGTDVPVVDFMDTDEKSPGIASHFADIAVVVDIMYPEEFRSIGIKHSQDAGQSWLPEDDIYIFDFGIEFENELPVIDYDGVTGAYGSCLPVFSKTETLTLTIPDINNIETMTGTIWESAEENYIHSLDVAGVANEYTPNQFCQGFILENTDDGANNYTYLLLWQDSTNSMRGISFVEPLPYDLGNVACDVDLEAGRIYEVWEYTNYDAHSDGIFMDWCTLDGTNDWYKDNWGELILETEGINPDIKAHNETVLLVYEINGDIICTHSSNGVSFSTHNITNTPGETEQFPEVSIDAAGNGACIFTKNGNLYISVSEDKGVTWSEPEQINDENGHAVEEYACADIDRGFTVWTDDRNGDDDIYFDPVGVANNPPNAPEIEGQTSGKTGTSYVYEFTSSDPDGDQVSYYIKWGDGHTTDWTSYQSSGTSYSESHTWDAEGEYTIEAKTRDIYGSESDWGDPLIILVEDEPPEVEICTPVRGLYINNKMIRPYLIRMALIIGDITIEVNATDKGSGIDRVEFYIGLLGNEFLGNDTTAPYNFTWERDRFRFFHMHILTIKAYDNAGNQEVKRRLVRRFL